ncbi:hypothetical protein, partial [Streptomyces sp. GSL17-113]|uniref:hypothetical protein n=1 Tax=Streptomyces sp. GSL17-113 TaxID=3115365 RepID=UPI002E770B99
LKDLRHKFHDAYRAATNKLVTGDGTRIEVWDKPLAEWLGHGSFPGLEPTLALWKVRLENESLVRKLESDLQDAVPTHLSLRNADRGYAPGTDAAVFDANEVVEPAISEVQAAGVRIVGGRDPEKLSMEVL